MSETVEGGTMIAIVNHSFYQPFHCLATYSAASDPRPQMIPRPEMIPKLDRK